MGLRLRFLPLRLGPREEGQALPHFPILQDGKGAVN